MTMQGAEARLFGGRIPPAAGAYSYNPSVNWAMLPVLPERATRILDIGGGRGDNALFARDELGGQAAVVAEVSAEAVAERLPGVAHSEVLDVEAHGALEALFDGHGPFDLVLALDVLEHLRDPWRVIARLHDLMPMGGSIVASVPNVQNYRAIIRTVTGTWNYRDTGLFDRTHLRYFARRSALQLMTCTGLEVRGVRSAYGGQAAPQTDRPGHLRGADAVLDAAVSGAGREDRPAAEGTPGRADRR